MDLKRGVFIFAVLCMLIPFVAAEENDTEEAKINQAYVCLQGGINNRTTVTLSLQEALFGVLALGDNTRAVQKLDSENRSVTTNQTCWPRSSCTIKETAQALLAYRALGRDTTKIENWLLSKAGPTTGLTWFLEIDIENHVPSTCHVRYPGTDRTITIGSDMRISGDLSGTCLSIIPTGYWLEIAPTCIDRSYEVSCDQDFLTTLLYQQSGSETLFVSPNTHSKPAGGSTNESISSKCFKSGATSDCDYEGSLWSTVALDAEGVNVANYIPYLVAFSDTQERFLPSSFIYKLTGGQDHYATLLAEQRTNQFWEADNSAYRKFYDTALALWALQGTSAPEIVNAKTYLLEVQGASGCWDNNNLRSTAFILYAGWPDSRPGGGPGGSGGTPGPGPGGNDSSVESCVDANIRYSCVESLLQCGEAGGEELRNYNCAGGLYCCSQTPQAPTCAELTGELCEFDEECDGSLLDSADGQCCAGSCIPLTEPTTTECEDNGGACSTSDCLAGEVESDLACASSGEICCILEDGTGGSGTSGGSSVWLWIILLVVLIIAVVLAIIYRKRLQMMFHKGRRDTSSTSSPIMIRRPPFPPATAPARYGVRPQPAQQTRRPQSQTDKEMEETLKKLREMSK